MTQSCLILHIRDNYTQLLTNITRDTTDIHSMAVHLSYETSKFKGMTKPLQELLHQVTMLVANLVAMSERIKQLDQIDVNYRPYLLEFHQKVDDFLANKHAILENELKHLPEYFDQEFQTITEHATAEQQVMLGSFKNGYSPFYSKCSCSGVYLAMYATRQS